MIVSPSRSAPTTPEASGRPRGGQTTVRSCRTLVSTCVQLDRLRFDLSLSGLSKSGAFSPRRFRSHPPSCRHPQSGRKATRSRLFPDRALSCASLCGGRPYPYTRPAPVGTSAGSRYATTSDPAHDLPLRFLRHDRPGPGPTRDATHARSVATSSQRSGAKPRRWSRWPGCGVASNRSGRPRNIPSPGAERHVGDSWRRHQRQPRSGSRCAFAGAHGAGRRRGTRRRFHSRHDDQR